MLENTGNAGKNMKKKRLRFHNRYGYIKIGTPVWFQMENQSLWGGDNSGILAYNEKTREYVIDTENSGRLKTSGYLSVYWNTIIPKTLT